MGRKCVLALICFATVLYAAGCSPKKNKLAERLAAAEGKQMGQLPPADGGVVISIGKEPITAESIIMPLVGVFENAAKNREFEEFRAIAKPDIDQYTTNRVANIILYQKAKSQAGEDFEDRLEKVVNSEIKKFILSFGGDYARAEAAIKEKGMSWEDFRDYQRRMMLSQSYIATMMPEDRPVSHEELKQTYERMKDKYTTKAQIEFALIDIQPEKIDANDPNTSPVELAGQMADELARRAKGGEDFAELAKTYSHGHRASYGGLWKPVSPDALAKPYDIIAEKAKDMQTGVIAGPVSVDGHFFIIRLINKQLAETKELWQVQDELEAVIELERRRDGLDKVSRKLIEQAAITNKDAFVDYCVERIYWQARMM